jgi:cytochrome c5
LHTAVHVAFVAFSSFIVAGCDQRPSTPSTNQLATLKPADPRVAQLYEHSCKACHAAIGSGAPLVHDKEAWNPRWLKGLSTLRDHAIVGFQSMPAGGQCAVCTPKDYEVLIRFMADREKR